MNYELFRAVNDLAGRMDPADDLMELAARWLIFPAFAVAAAIGWFLHRRWGITLLVTATVIGVARIWVGVHYPGDILAGLGIALASVLVIEAATRLVHPLNGSSASCTP
ncbi:phosphatase PAP2 family protein [Dactylosporangium maewongense]